jgi:hypothetical protein
VVTPARVLLVVTLGTVGLLGACTTVPVAPSVMALPGPAKSLDQFHADDTVCRQWASQQDQATAATAAQSYGAGLRQRWYDMAYLQCMYAKGNQIPGVVVGAPPPPPPGPPAPPPAQAP